MTTLVVGNNGPDIRSTNYWQSEYAKGGIVFLSMNAGAFCLLLPPALESTLADMRTAKEVIVSRGPWPGQKPDAFEIMFEDGSGAPFALHFGVEQIDHAPSGADEGRRDLLCTVWTAGPRKVLELPAAYRRVSQIPCLAAME